MRKSGVELTRSAEVAQRGSPATAAKGSSRTPVTLDARRSGSESGQDFIAIISTHVLTRDCLARVLSAECSVEVETFLTIEEWQAARQPARASLVVLCQC